MYCTWESIDTDHGRRTTDHGQHTLNLFYYLKEDGVWVQGLKVELTEVAELLYNEIDGPRSFQPRRVVDILTEMQSKIISVNVGFDGNWLSVFIRLRPKGRRQMLISTKTRKVRCMHRSCLSRCVNRTNDLQ
jgi:hypothetical protein